MQKNSKKEIIIIASLFLLLVGSFFLVKLLNRNNAENVSHLEVRYKDEVIKVIDIDKDDIYTIEVDLGHMHIEVKDSKYRVFDVDCPDKICEKVGWVKKGSETLIICLPNNIVLVQV